MEIGLILILLIGIGLVIGGGLVMFTEQGLEWMYRKGIWKRKSNILDDKDRKWFDRYASAGAWFLGGVVIVIMSLWALFI